jgi:hypothetical protein
MAKKRTGWQPRNFYLLSELDTLVGSPFSKATIVMNEHPFVIEEVTDPAEVARSKTQHEHHKRNTDWLQAHWGDLLPQARGKFLAVANHEAYVAETPEAAWASTEPTYPDDDGAFVQYVRTDEGPRIYVNRR